MLLKQKWMSLSRYIEYEIQQTIDEGKDISALQGQIEDIRSLDMEDPRREYKSKELYNLMQEIESPTTNIEPSDLDSIKKLRPVDNYSFDVVDSSISQEVLYDKIYGAWLGRCSGCLLGKPVENWSRAKIDGFLRDTGNYPLSYYLSSDIGDVLREKYDIGSQNFQHSGFINNINCMPEDDDLNFTVLALKLVMEAGMDFNSDKVAEHWLCNMPVLSLCTAERTAYINLCNLTLPPFSAVRFNPYREWIGAQIRGDFYGYITPFDPEKGAEMAFYDASISHVRNGIYGAMFVAAMLSSAYGTDNMVYIINSGLAQIPKDSRMSVEINNVLDWYHEGVSAEEAINRVHQMYDEKNNHHWCHAVSNAMVVCVSLLFSGLDFEEGIRLAVTAGFDTDCNGATVGSILGLILGERELPSKWIEPLNDRLLTSINGFTSCKISDLAKITQEIVNENYSL